MFFQFPKSWLLAEPYYLLSPSNLPSRYATLLSLGLRKNLVTSDCQIQCSSYFPSFLEHLMVRPTCLSLEPSFLLVSTTVYSIKPVSDFLGPSLGYPLQATLLSLLSGCCACVSLLSPSAYFSWEISSTPWPNQISVSCLNTSNAFL